MPKSKKTPTEERLEALNNNVIYLDPENNISAYASANFNASPGETKKCSITIKHTAGNRSKAEITIRGIDELRKLAAGIVETIVLASEPDHNKEVTP